MFPPRLSSQPVSPSVVTETVPAQRPPRWTPWAGVGYLALTFTGLSLAPLPDLGARVDKMHQFLASASPVPYATGGLAQLVAYLCLVMFAAGLTTPARASGHRSAAVVLVLVGAGLATAAIMTAAALVGAVVLTRHLSATTGQVLISAGSLATWLSVAGIAVTLAALAVLGPRGTSLPRQATLAAAAFAALLATAVPLAETPWAHIPALLVDIWVLVIAIVLLRRHAPTR